MTALISTEALTARLDEPNLRLADASWHMPSEQRDARAEYERMHIPGAVFFDIDAISDRQSPFPHMLPTAAAFGQAVGAMGIGNDSEVVVYDSSGLFSAARLWWMFRVFGHDKVHVLDGGLPKWSAEGRQTESGKVTATPGAFNAKFCGNLVRGMAEIRNNLQGKHEQLIDARSPARFSGAEAEPRPGLRSGHIPGSRNVYFRDCLSPPYNTLKPGGELHALFSARAISPGQPLVASCGSGVTACILALALYELGNENVAVYDGSWTEWGSQQPIA